MLLAKSYQHGGRVASAARISTQIVRFWSKSLVIQLEFKHNEALSSFCLYDQEIGRTLNRSCKAPKGGQQR